MIDRRLKFALGLSLGVHLALMALPGWQPPPPVDALSQVIEARLALRPVAQPAPPPSAAKSTAQPATRPPAKAATPRSPVARVSGEGARDGDGGGDAAAAGVEPVPLPAPAPPARPTIPSVVPEPPAAGPALAIRLPAVGRIRFRIATANGFELGQATHVWALEGDRYVLRATLETTGLAALLRSVEVRQVSSGRITADGLLPLEFSSSRGGKVTEQARFDWELRQLSMSTGGRSGVHSLVTGSQDLLSVFYQAALFPPADSSAWMVATGKGYERQVFERVGEERLDSHLGSLAALHLRVGGDRSDRIDLWLSIDHALLPIRIRYVDRKGEVNQQDAVEIEYPGVLLRPPPPPPQPPSY